MNKLYRIFGLIRLSCRRLYRSLSRCCLFRRCLQLCVFLLFCSWMLFLDCHGDYPGNLEKYIQAVSLYESGQIALLMAAILPVCLEDLPS